MVKPLLRLSCDITKGSMSWVATRTVQGAFAGAKRYPVAHPPAR